MRAEEIRRIVQNTCPPDAVNSTITATSEDQQWVFWSWLGASDTYMYFTDGVLRAVQL
jgi:hypothetical protein